MMVNTSNWDKFSKRIVLGLVMPALVAAVAQTFQQLAQRAFLNTGGGRSVSDCHFLLSFPDSLKIAPMPARVCAVPPAVSGP